MRQKQLEEGYVDPSGKPQPGFWQPYIENGAQVMRHDGSIASARRIVDKIIVNSTPLFIQIQDEVHAGKDLPQTAAGQAIKTDLEKDAEKTKEEFANLKAEMEGALKDAKEDRDQLRQQYEEEISSVKKKMDTQAEQQKKLIEATYAALKIQIEPRRKWWQDLVPVVLNEALVRNRPSNSWF